MNRFEYVSPSSLSEALAQLLEPGAVAKAGGVDLLDRMKEGLVAPARLVNLSSLRELDFVRDEGKDGLRIGPLVTLSALAAHPLVRGRFGALAAACEHVATPQIRNMATLGGNLLQRPRCHYFRSADFTCRKKGGETCFAQDGENQFHALFGNHTCAIIHPSTPATALCAYGARIQLTASAGPGGTRELPLESFFTPPELDVTRENALQPHEIATAIHLPAPAASARAAYHKQGEKESFDWPLCDVAVVLDMEGRLCRRASIVLGAVAPVPLRAKAAEALLAGHPVDEASAASAARAAVAGATPLSKNRYKVQVVETVVRRTLLAAGAA